MRIASFVVLTFILILSVSTGFSQVDYNDIKQKINNKESNTYYSLLVQRFLDSDSTLTMEDFQLLYFGATLQNNFDADKIMEAEREIRLANYSGEFYEAYQLSDSLLKIFPLSIQAYFEKAYACYNLKRFDEESYNTKRYKILIKTILSKGDGKTFETAYTANLANDKYETIKYLGLAYKEEMEVEYNGKLYDVFTLKPNKSKLKNLYFFASPY
jgi:hypothetical protein